jgi:hypothetical protein
MSGGNPMNKHQLFDLAILTGIEQARGLQEAQTGKTPNFVSQALINSTLEDSTIEGRVARFVAPANMLRGTVFVAQGQSCFLVRIPNPRNYSWFAHRFYVVTHDELRGYRCSCPNEQVRPFVIEQVKKFVAAELA